MDPFTKAKLGPLPLPYVSVIVLLPLWIFYSVGESSLLYSIFVIGTVLLKGSLLSHWVIYRYAPFQQWIILVVGVTVLEGYIIGDALQISLFPLVFLVPLSNVTGIGVFHLHLDSGEEARSSSQVIGIFSRCSASEYNWLMAELKASGKVVPFYISNGNFREFREQVPKCTLAILYHSKTRGRVNITDVTDSLYDEEVQYMAQSLGREKVLVVVDDLDDSSDSARSNILHNQPKIRDKARDLYLFTTDEKRDKERIREKLQPILNTLCQKSPSHPIGDVIATLILCAPWLHYCFGVYHGFVLILSNIEGSLLLGNFLLPLSRGSAQAGLPALLLVMVSDLVAAVWYYSGMKLLFLVVQSVSPALYAALSSSTPFSAAPKYSS